MSNSIASIGPDMIEASGNLLRGLLKKHMPAIDKAYLKSPDTFSVGLKLKYKPVDNGEIKIGAYIEFVTDKIKDDVSGQMKEGQMTLFRDKRETDVETEIVEDKTKMIGSATPELMSSNPDCCRVCGRTDDDYPEEDWEWSEDGLCSVCKGKAEKKTQGKK